jgi:hypothetical protein
VPLSPHVDACYADEETIGYVITDEPYELTSTFYVNTQFDVVFRSKIGWNTSGEIA